jgi:uncharacterized protein YbjT (DUF2867 family)
MRRRACLAAGVAWLALGTTADGAASGATASGGPPGTARSTEAPLLVIAGASGRTGSRILRAVPAGRYRIRALSGDLARARRELGRSLYSRAEWREVDVRDPAAVKAALAGASYVISAIGARAFEGASSPQFIDFQGAVNLVDAAQAAGVARFVMISSASAGSHRDQSQVPRLGHVLLYKTQAEEHLKASGVAYTIVGPAGLLDRPAGRDGLELLPRADYVSTNVSRDDVARVALDALQNPDADRKSFALVGDRRGDPEAWRAQLRTLPRDDRSSLEALAWMAGHWRDGDREELWLAPRGGLMLGLNRELRAGQPAHFEFLRIEARADGSLVYLASPGGRAVTPFRLTTLGAQRAVFTNPAHDFPKILTYWREDDRLHARADGVENGVRQSLEYAWTASSP